jgi:hypothetical protein
VRDDAPLIEMIALERNYPANGIVGNTEDVPERAAAD